MREILLLLVVALVAAGIVFGVAVLITGGDRGLGRAEPDDRYRRPPGDRPLVEDDMAELRFDTVLRGYRMAQVDQALGRIGYDLGYKEELIDALEAEVAALREGRTADADRLRDRRLAAREPDGPTTTTAATDTGTGGDQVDHPGTDASTDVPTADTTGTPGDRAVGERTPTDGADDGAGSGEDATPGGDASRGDVADGDVAGAGTPREDADPAEPADGSGRGDTHHALTPPR